MNHLIIEIKARCKDPEPIRAVLMSRGAEFVGYDEQVDTYFNCPTGRLKLREGNIERALIHYTREDRAGPKRSEVTLYKPEPGPELKIILTRALGVRVEVRKLREIYYIGNVKFHIDHVDELGHFVEIEAIGKSLAADPEELHRQCREYLDLFGIEGWELVKNSYSDMLLESSGPPERL
jgi:adenylate cyclase class 2